MTQTESTRGTRTIDRELRIDAPIEDVWKAITDGAEVQRWFAPEAESTPGPGGMIRLHWGPDVTWDMPIAQWEPPHRLVIGDEGDAGTEAHLDAEPSDAALRIEYTLESDAGATVLRLTHSGFGTSGQWDEIYDGTSRGWTYELRALKHYLENHKGELRRLVRARAPISIPLDAAWKKLLGPGAIGLGCDPATLKEGDRFEAASVTGERFTGRVIMRSGTCLGVAIDQFNNALLRVIVERWCGGEKRMEAMVWLSTHDVDRETVEAFEKRWNRTLARLFAACDHHHHQHPR